MKNDHFEIVFLGAQVKDMRVTSIGLVFEVIGSFPFFQLGKFTSGDLNCSGWSQTSRLQ